MAKRGTIAAGAVISDALSGLGSRASRSLRVPIELLAAVPLFAGLSRRHLRKLAELTDEVHYRDGRAIVQAGRPGTTFFVIADGAAKVYTGSSTDGRAKARLGRGDFFGEIALLDGGPRSATVVADGNVTAIRLNRSSFLKLVSREPSVAVAIMSGLAGRLRRGTATE